MKTKNKTAKKLLSLVLSLLMVITSLPMAVLPVSAAGEVTINTTSSTSGVVVIGGNSRWSNSTFNIVNDQEAGNTSAGIIQYDISSLRGKKITTAKFTAVVDSVDGDNQPTGFFYSTSAACGTYVTSGGKETLNVGGNTGAGVIGCNSLLSALGTTSSHKVGETSSAGTFEYDIKNIVQRLADGNISTLYIIVAKTKAGGSGSSGGWTDTKVRPAAQRLYVTAADKPAAFTDTAYGSVDWTTPTITTVHGSFYNDNDNVTDAEYAQIYQNLIYAENAIGYDNAAAGTGIGTNTNSNDPFDGIDKVYGVRRIYYPTVVMLYDGQTIPKFGAMFLMDPTDKPWNWNYKNIRAFSAGFSGNQDALTFTGNWRGADGSMNNQWNYISHSDSDVTTTDQSSGYLKTGTGDARYFSNIITYQGSDFSASYKTITPSFFNRVGHDIGNNYMTYDSVKSVYVLNYKKALDKIAEMKSFMNSFNQNDWTIKSVNAFYTAINNLVQFNPSALKYDYASNTASAVQAAGNDMDSLIAAVDTAKANLRHGVTFVFTNGTTKVYEVADGGSVTAPANTATYIETSGNTHTRHTYSWNATATNVKTNLTISEVDTTESVPCNFVRTSTKTEQSCTDAEVAIFTCSNADGFTGCGATEERTMNPALGHDFTEQVIDDAHLKSAATCTAKAVYYYDCSRCDVISTETFEYGELAAHTPGEWIVDTDSDCTNGGTKHQVCSVCGATIATDTIAAKGHTEVSADNAVAATCTTAGKESDTVCSVCGVTITTGATIDALGHSFTNYVSNNDATCTADGTKTAKCDRCDATDTIADTGSAKGHTEETIPGKAATCTETGLTDGVKCSVCGEILTAQEEIPAKGHTPGEWVVDADSDCTNGGTKHQVCSVCGATIATETIPAKGHSYEATVTAPTCTADGFTAHICKVCGDTYTDAKTDKLGHSFTNYVSNNDATCKVDGTKTAKCDRCDVTDTITDVDSHLSVAHTPAEAVRENEVAATCTADGSYDSVVYCSVCDAEISRETKTIDKLGHSFTNYVSNNDATCKVDGTKTAKCDRCDVTDTITDVDSHLSVAHTPAEAVRENEEAATCTADGSYDSVVYCSVCDAEISRETKTIDKLGHSFTNYVSNNDATCKVDGTKTAKCDRCDVTDTITDVDSHLSVAHTPAEAVRENEEAATCTADGSYDSVVYCSVCDAEISRETKTIDKLGHSFTNYVSNNDATCKVDGTKTAKCDRCDVTDTITDVDSHLSVAHTPAEAVRENEEAATCTADGSYDSVVYCSVCDAEISRETKTIDKLGHTTATREENRVEASCGTDGSYDLVTYCSVCNEVLSTEHKTIAATGEHNYVTEVEGTKTPATCVKEGSVTMSCGCGATKVVTLAIDPNNHANVVVDAAVPATCETTGLTEGSHCEACKTVIVKQEVVLALGHDKVNHDAKAPTCTEKGWDAYETCSRCDYTTYVEKAALGHDKVNHDAKAPTCTEKGWDAYETCSRCDYTTYVEKAALGHDKVNHDAKAPTCTEIGWEAYETCKRCDYTTYKEIAALGHDIVTDEAVAATCTTTGLTEGSHCTRCEDATVAQQVIPALGHSFTNYVSNNNATCTADGTKTAKCDRCDVTDTIADVGSAKGHDYGEWTVEKAATCTEKGTEKRVCANDASHVETRETEKIAHTEVIIPAVAATCTEKGKTEGKKCSVCGEILVAQTETAINPDNHASITPVAEVPATCSSTGIKAHFKCACGKLFADEAGTTEVTAESLVLPIDPSLHVMEETKRIEATCFAEGYIKRTCKNCGFIESETIPMLTHRWSEWQVVSTATCQSRAVRQRTCASCKTVESEEFGALAPHSLIVEPGKPAGCEYDGRTDYRYCVVCGYTEPSYVIPATGHNDADGDGKCDECHKNLTGECDDCFCHNDNLFSRIVRFIYTLFSKIFRKRITCCDDMEYYKGDIGSLT